MANTGLSMMLKSLGVDPKMLEQVATAVGQAANDLKTIKEQNTEIIRLLRGEVENSLVRVNGNDTGRESEAGRVEGERSS